MKKLLLIALPVLLSSCMSSIVTGKLYNLKTGQVMPAQFSYDGTGKGKISVTLPDGRLATGEYNTQVGGSTWGSFYGYGGGLATPNDQKGTAIAADGKGFIIQCEYVTSPYTGGGAGGCQDNEGVTYKLTFAVF